MLMLERNLGALVAFGAVTLDPGCDFVINAHTGCDDIQRLAV